MTRLWYSAVALVLGFVPLSLSSAQQVRVDPPAAAAILNEPVPAAVVPVASRHRTVVDTSGSYYHPTLIEQALGSNRGWGSGPYNTLDGSATYEESLYAGPARYLQGAGSYNRNTAEAIRTLESAKAMYYENERARIKTYFDIKQMNADYRAAQFVPISKEKLDEWNRQDQPERLTRAQYNVDTGSLRWPALLQTQVFDDQRIKLEDLFARRTANEFGPDSDFYRQVTQATDVVKSRLKEYLRSNDKFFTDEEYVAAQKFLNSLSHEARLAPDMEGLAAN